MTNSTVYAGGTFSTANGVARSRLAAFSAASGALTAWAPVADNIVDALQLTPDGTHVIVGGAFGHLGGAVAPGVGSVSSASGASTPFAVNQVVQDSGSGSAILSLSTDGTAVYGTGYSTTNGFEGVFSANPTTGAVNWLEDCHGDSYGVFASPAYVYTVSHAHFCGNVSGFPETAPRTYQRTVAFTRNATGAVQPNIDATYGSFTGQPAPSLVTWFPDLDEGTVTGQHQGPWTVTGTSRYVVEGGEFEHVNGVGQQGLVRFAVPAVAPDNDGPVDTTTANIPTLTAVSHTSVRLTWLTNWDRDDATLTYRVYRNGALVVHGDGDVDLLEPALPDVHRHRRHRPARRRSTTSTRATRPATAPEAERPRSRPRSQERSATTWRTIAGRFIASPLDTHAVIPIRSASATTVGSRNALNSRMICSGRSARMRAATSSPVIVGIWLSSSTTVGTGGGFERVERRERLGAVLRLPRHGDTGVLEDARWRGNACPGRRRR